MDLFTADYFDKRQQADDRSGFPECSLVHQRKVWRFSPDRLVGQKSRKNIFSVFKCVQQGCEFVVINGRRTCPQHRVSHECGLECDILLKHARLMALPITNTDCLLKFKDQEKLRDERMCKILPGIDQKHREVIMFDATNNKTHWVVNDTRAADKRQVRHQVCRSLIEDFLGLANIFLILLERTDRSNECAMYAKKEIAGLRCEMIALYLRSDCGVAQSTFDRVALKCIEYTTLAVNLLYDEALGWYVQLYTKSLMTDNGEDRLSVLLIFLLVVFKQTSRNVSYHYVNGVVQNMFLKTDMVAHAHFTHMERDVHRLFTERRTITLSTAQFIDKTQWRAHVQILEDVQKQFLIRAIPYLVGFLNTLECAFGAVFYDQWVTNYDQGAMSSRVEEQTFDKMERLLTIVNTFEILGHLTAPWSAEQYGLLFARLEMSPNVVYRYSQWLETTDVSTVPLKTFCADIAKLVETEIRGTKLITVQYGNDLLLELDLFNVHSQRYEDYSDT